MLNEPAKCYVHWKSKKKKFSFDKFKKFLFEAQKNTDFMMFDVELSSEILEIPYCVHDNIKEEDIPVVHMPSLMNFCSHVRSAHLQDSKAFSKALIDYVDALVYLIVECASDMLTIQLLYPFKNINLSHIYTTYVFDISI